MCKTQIAVIFGTPFVSIWGHPTKSHTKTTPKTNRTAMNCHELPVRMANLRFPNYQPLALLMNFIRKYPEKNHRKLSSATSGPSNTWHNWANKKLTHLYTCHSISSNFNVFCDANFTSVSPILTPFLDFCNVIISHNVSNHLHPRTKYMFEHKTCATDLNRNDAVALFWCLITRSKKSP